MSEVKATRYESTGRLEGKVALITGAAGGIGAGVVQLFLEEGARVVLAGRDEAALAEVATTHPKERFRVVKCDVSAPDEVAQAVDVAASSFQGLDVLCNIAGVLRHGKPFTELTAEDLDIDHAVNLKGTIFGMQRAVPLMIERGGGSIVNISSVAGILSSSLSPYALSKAAVAHLTRAAAAQLGNHKIRVNAIAPGLIDTPMLTRALISAFGDVAAGASLWEKTPLGRVGTPRDVATVALFLASDESSYVTGTVLPVDGGLIAAAA